MDEVQDIADQILFETEKGAQEMLNKIAPDHRIVVDKNNNARVIGPKYNFEIKLSNESLKMTEEEREELWEEETEHDWNNAKLVLPKVKRKLPFDAEPLSVDLKLKSVEIDIETADNIVTASMFDLYYSLKKEIEYRKTIKNPAKWWKEDLEDNEELLDATITILKHFAAYTKWPEELKDKEEMA